MLGKTMRLNYLLDFYQALLTDKQQEYMKMYYWEDLSLVEISELASVSRQAIYDNIKRTEAILETYEEKLFLYERFKKRTKIIDQLQEKVAQKSDSELNDLMKQLSELN